jgi:hypothetical protein
MIVCFAEDANTLSRSLVRYLSTGFLLFLAESDASSFEEVDFAVFRLVFFFFQKKKQKALFCFSEEANSLEFDFLLEVLRLTTQGLQSHCQHFSAGFLLFPEKEAKSVVLLRRRWLATQTSAKPTQGGLGG